MRKLPTTLSLLMITTAIGCAVPAEEAVRSTESGLALAATPADEEAPIVASVTLPNDTRVEFRAIDGELLIVTDHPASATAPAAVERFERHEIDASTLYETLSGKRAPDALRKAVADARLAAAESGGGEGDSESSSSLGLTGSTQPQASCGWSANGWDDKYCDWPGADVLFCHPVWHGNYYAKIHSYDMTFRVQANTNPLDVRFRYKRLGNWHTSYSFTVLPCYVKRMSGSGVRRDRKGEIRNNEEGYSSRTQAFAYVD